MHVHICIPICLYGRSYRTWISLSTCMHMYARTDMYRYIYMYKTNVRTTCICIVVGTLGRHGKAQGRWRHNHLQYGNRRLREVGMGPGIGTFRQHGLHSWAAWLRIFAFAGAGTLEQFGEGMNLKMEPNSPYIHTYPIAESTCMYICVHACVYLSVHICVSIMMSDHIVPVCRFYI